MTHVAKIDFRYMWNIRGLSIRNAKSLNFLTPEGPQTRADSIQSTRFAKVLLELGEHFRWKDERSQGRKKFNKTKVTFLSEVYMV